MCKTKSEDTTSVQGEKCTENKQVAKLDSVELTLIKRSSFDFFKSFSVEILSLHGRGEEDGCRGYNKRDETKEGRITKQNNGATRHGRWMVGDRGRDRKREGDSEREWF